MPYIEHGDQQFPLGSADLTIGAFDGAAVRLPGADPLARAVVSVGPDGRGVIRRGAPEAVVLVNNVRLGVEPSPLMHGDKVEIGGATLGYGDDQKGGSTQFVSAADIADAVKATKAGAPRKPTTATGGRLVSLVDGREYPVSDAGVTFGREVGNEIVVASNDVSRRHATIKPAENGYVLTDTSTNGVYVNGTKLDKSAVLGRGDVIKIGPEEFRFYADVAKAAPAAPVAPVAPVAVEPTAPPAIPEMKLDLIEIESPIAAATPMPTPAMAPQPHVPAPVEVTAPAVTPTPGPVVPAPAPVAAAPAPAAPAARPSLATLEIINEGPMKGIKFDLHAALTNIGRGEHNDISVADESVSDSHAKILKRDGAWWLVDQGSTNGTYLAGRRIAGEVELVGAPDVRFGGVKMTFRPAADASAADTKGTRAIAALNIDATKRMPKASPRSTAATPAPVADSSSSLPTAAPKKKGCAAVFVLFLSIAAAAVTSVAALVLSVIR